MFNSEDRRTTVTPLEMFTAEEGRAAITPIDLRQAKFATAMRGFDRTEVTTLLEHASSGFEQALRDNERLRQEIARLEASLNQYRELESSIKTTLVTTQKVADDIRDAAQQDAARIIRDAEGKAEALLQKAQARIEEAQREIDALKLKRREAETQIEATVLALQHTLDFVRDQDQRERRDVVAIRLPQFEAATA